MTARIIGSSRFICPCSLGISEKIKAYFFPVAVSSESPGECSDCPGLVSCLSNLSRSAGIMTREVGNLIGKPEPKKPVCWVCIVVVVRGVAGY